MGVICGVALSGADIYLCGDSTICNYKSKFAPLSGWGMALQNLCVDGVKVVNEGSSGATSRTIRIRGNWKRIIDNVRPGDYVVIQFGHNDQKKNTQKRPNIHCGLKTAYPANLTAFINEVRAKKAHPVLATSICRRTFRKGKLVDGAHLRDYCEAAIAVGKKENVPVIDMNKLTTKKVAALGDAGSRKIYNHLKPGESPNWPKGRKDNTHLNATGAKIFAKIFVDEVKAQKLPMAALFR